MKRNKISAVILSIVMSMSLMMPSFEVMADETSAPSETQKTETVETTEPKATEKQTPKETDKQEPKETETQEPKETETQEPKGTEKQEPKETETQEPKETEKQEPKETDETHITETAGSDEKDPAESEDNGETPDESNETTVVEGKIPSQSASTPKKNAVTGTCGDNLTWTFFNDDGSGTLTISGSGKMFSWKSNDISTNNAPWKEYSNTIQKVVISDNVTTIGDNAFVCCQALSNVIIPNSVTSIGENAFANCPSIRSINLPDSITSINSGTFCQCYNLTDITIPFGVLTIGDNAFSVCTYLSKITIPNSVVSIGDSAFWNCLNLSRINFGGSADDWNSISIGSNNGQLLNATIHYYLATSGNCGDNLTWSFEDGTLTISGSGNMSDYTNDNGKNPVPWMEYRESISSVVFSGDITSIGSYAFDKCSSLTSITIPDSVTSIGRNAFSNCSSLTNITIPNGVTSIGISAFCYCIKLTSITIPDSVTSIGDDAFQNCSSLTSITIPNGVTSIGTSEFYNCSSLTSITIPDSVTSIGKNAFSRCSSLTSITMPKSVTSIGDYAFLYCSKLTSITIPDSVTSIGRNAFSYCSSLTSITMPKSVTSIGDYAFDKCSSLANVFYFGTEDNWKAITVGNNNEPLQNANIHFVVSYSITVNSGMSDLAKAAEGTTVTVTANDAPSGEVFDKWTVVSGNVTFANELSSTTTFTMPDGNVEVTATYKSVPPRNFIVKVNNGVATPSTSAPGLVVNVTANEAPEGTEFDKWEVVSGTVIFADSSSATTFFVMPAENVEITAKYKSSLSVKGKTATVKYSKVKKKNQTLAVSKVLTFVDKGQGQLTYAKVSGNSKILINKTTGAITVKKKLKKKTYTVKVKVQASGNESCNPSGWKTVTFKIKVK